MAASDLSGFNGAVVLPSGIGGEAAGFSLRRSMATKDVSRYGTDRFNKHRGGSIGVSGDINLFLRKGASATSPGIANPAADGAALTLTLDTGCSVSGTAIFPDLNIQHRFNDPAIEATQSYLFSGTVTETWAIT